MSTSELTREDLAAVSPVWWVAALLTIVALAVTFVVRPGLFIDQAIGGLVYGMVLVLVTLGLSLILGLMGIVNFAHGAFFMLGAYVSYTVVVQLERVGADGAVVDRIELDRLSATVAPGERWTRQHEVTPTTTGEDLRLSYLLFVGDAPADPTREDARHATHVWVTVEP